MERHGKAAGVAAPAAPPPTGGGYLFNHKALAKVFRAKLLSAVEPAGLSLPPKLPDTSVVDCRLPDDDHGFCAPRM